MLKKRELRLKSEQAGLKSLISGLVGGPALLTLTELTNSAILGQESFDPYNGEAGDGLYPNGSAVSPPTSQTLAYTPWNTAMASTWLKGMTNKPKLVLIDNEIEIASSTHQDMHPEYVALTVLLFKQG